LKCVASQSTGLALYSSMNINVLSYSTSLKITIIKGEGGKEYKNRVEK
jgi:hypothetical protein